MGGWMGYKEKGRLEKGNTRVAGDKCTTQKWLAGMQGMKASGNCLKLNESIV